MLSKKLRCSEIKSYAMCNAIEMISNKSENSEHFVRFVVLMHSRSRVFCCWNIIDTNKFEIMEYQKVFEKRVCVWSECIDSVTLNNHFEWHTFCAFDAITITFPFFKCYTTSIPLGILLVDLVFVFYIPFFLLTTQIKLHFNWNRQFNPFRCIL